MLRRVSDNGAISDPIPTYAPPQPAAMTAPPSAAIEIVELGLDAIQPGGVEGHEGQLDVVGLGPRGDVFGHVGREVVWSTIPMRTSPGCNERM